MSHFYGVFQSNITRTGHKRTGMDCTLASWKGAVYVRIYHDAATGLDHYEVSQRRWQNGAGVVEVVACGVIGETQAATKKRERKEKRARIKAAAEAAE